MLTRPPIFLFSWNPHDPQNPVRPARYAEHHALMTWNGFSVFLRITAALPGGYAFSAACVALLTAGLPRLGLSRSEAVASAAMAGFVLYLLVLLWAFSVRSLARLWAVLAAGTALACGLLFLIR